MNRKIVFLDIDGTLSIENRVPPSAKRACRAARKNGHLLYICTGRARLQIRPAIIRIGFDGIVSSGGAYVETMESGGAKILSASSIEPEKLRALTAYFERHGTAYILEFEDKLVAGPNFKAYFAEYYARLPFTFRRLAEQMFLRQVFKKCECGSPDRGGVRKLVFRDSGGITFKDVAREFGGGFELSRLSIPVSGMTGGEAGPQGIHKGAALEKVSAYHGFGRADTIAFGDSDNDRTMIQRAGMGVAMGNAVDSLKMIAGDVTDSVENQGLAKAFKKHGLV